MTKDVIYIEFSLSPSIHIYASKKIMRHEFIRKRNFVKRHNYNKPLSMVGNGRRHFTASFGMCDTAVPSDVRRRSADHDDVGCCLVVCRAEGFFAGNVQFRHGGHTFC